MEDRKPWLEDAIELYVKNHPNCDSVDIVIHFKLRADISLQSLSQLCEDNRVKRHHLFGFNYGYRYVEKNK